MPEAPEPIRIHLRDGGALPLPTTLERLLLCAALADRAPARMAWIDWRRSGGDIDSVDMSTFRLLPLVYRNLEASGVEDPDSSRLKGVYRHAWAANQRLVHCVAPALEALGREGIPTMVLKGAAAIVAHYHDLGTRPMDDIDVLVPRGDVKRALDVLGAMTWSPVAEIDPARLARAVHATPVEDQAGTQIDLHWRVLRESVDDEEFWSAAVPAVVGKASTLVPAPEEQLLHACAHGVSPVPAPLRWIADATVIIRSTGSGMDWARFVNGAITRRLALRAGLALGVLQELLDLPIPAGVIPELGASSSGRREQLLLRHALRPTRLGAAVELWDIYRRRVAAEEYGRSLPEFVQYVADGRSLPSRAAVGPWFARHAAAWLRPSRAHET